MQLELPRFIFMSSNWQERRVVVTGLGVVTPLGNDVDTFWKRLIAGECGIDRITAFDPTGYDTQVAGQVSKLDLTAAFPNPKEVRRTDRYSQFGVHAGWQALKDSGADLSKLNCDEIGVILGSGIGGLETTQAQVKVLLERGPSRLSPFMIPMLISNMASGLFSMYNNLRGPNFATCSACATANHAIGEAWRTIKMGEAVMMFAGGSEAAIVPVGIGGFCSIRATTIRKARLVRSTKIAMVSSWAKARACCAWKIWNTQRNAVQKFIARSWAMATRRTHITSRLQPPAAKARHAA